MGYNLPNHVDLIKNIQAIRTQYLNKHPDRIQLINLLEALSHTVKLTETEILIGAYIYCLENIVFEYYIYDPQHKKGRFFNSGSTLYSLLFSHLYINEHNQITDIDKLNYLMKFYHFYHAHKTLMNEFLNEEKIIKIIQKIFKNITNDAKRLMHAIPCEEKLDQKMKEILFYYLNNNSNNENRIFLAKFAKYLAESHPAKEKKSSSNILLTRSIKIKIGFLLYTLLSIENSYIMRSPMNSNLYCLVCETLNIKHSIQIDNETKLVCLAALESFIYDNNNIQLLEKYSFINIDLELHNMRSQLLTIIENIKNSRPFFSASTLSTAAIGALIMSAPGYGLGFTLGKVLTQTNFIFNTKHLLSDLTGAISHQMFNNTGHYLTHFAANIVIDSTVERACAKLFETFGILMGTILGGSMGFIIFDLSSQTINSLCYLYKIIFPIVQNNYPDLADKADLQLIDCLLALPPEVFSQLNKDKIERLLPHQPQQLSLCTNLAKT